MTPKIVYFIHFTVSLVNFDVQIREIVKAFLLPLRVIDRNFNTRYLDGGETWI